MANLMKLVKQAQAVQKDMQRLQEQLAQRAVEFASGGGMVKVSARGDGSIASLKIDPSVIDKTDPEMLEDLILAAVNGGINAAKEMAAGEMSKLTSGLGLPGAFGGA